MLEVRDVELRYGRVTAVRGASLRVAEGEMVGLVGPNGAGKSTTLKAIAGLLAPVAGDVLLDGRSVLGAPGGPSTRGIGYVPEDRRVFASLSVAENLAIGATGRRDRDAVAADVERELDRFPMLRDALHTGAGELSGGQQQMLAISRALMGRPRLLVLDEPTLGLAPIMIDTIFDTIVALRASGVTILLVEQNTVRTVEVADRYYVMRSGGEIVHEGTPDDLDGDADRAYLQLL
jgi:branched-chain amino acid transport system ATP-binding protein